MSKMKTIKAVAKRVKVKKSGKMLIKKGGQDHFNSRESGKTTRAKRRTGKLSPVMRKNVNSFLAK